MPIFKEEKSKREKIAKLWLQNTNRTQQIKPSDLCSHKFLLNQANVFQKEQSNEFVENLEKMVDLMKETVLQRASANQKEPNIEEEQKLIELINFMKVKILKIEECKSYLQFCEGSEGIAMPEGFSDIKPIHDLSVISCSYLVMRIKKLIQANTFDYISWVCQLILIQFRDFLILECFEKETKKDTEPLLYSLVIMCGALSKARPERKIVFRDEGFRSLVYIINRISHIPTLQISILLLNIYESNYPYNEIETNDFQLKMLNWAELTNYFVINDQVETEFQPKIYIDFEPEKAFHKKFEKFERSEEVNLSEIVEKLVSPKANTEVSEKEEDEEIFSKLMTENNDRSESIKPPSKLFCFVPIDLKAITSLPKALKVRLGQEDPSLTKEEKIQMLRDGALSILEYSYKQVYDVVQLKNQLVDRILPWDEYNKKYEKFIEKGLLPLIEADIVFALSARNKLIEFQNLGLNSIQKFMRDRYYTFEFVSTEYFSVQNDPLNLKKRKDQFKSKDFLQTCIKLVEKSVDIQAKQSNEENLIKQQNENVFITSKFWRILKDLIDQVEFWDAYDENKKLHALLDKLLETDKNITDKTFKSQPYIIKLLNKTNRFNYKGDSLNELSIEQGNFDESQDVKISPFLINNQDFQYSLWKVAGLLYYSLKRICYRLHEYDSAQEHDLFKFCHPIKKQLEEISYVQLSKFPITLKQENVIILNQRGVVEEICDSMIYPLDRWERNFDRANQDNVRDQDNFKKLVDLLRANISALTKNEAYSISSTCLNSQTFQKIKISDSRLIYNVKQLIRKIQEHLGNAGDNSSNFSEKISEVFSQETFQFFIDSAQKNKSDQGNQKDLSEAWNTFFSFLSDCISKTPVIIDTMIKNGDFKRVLNFLCEEVTPVEKTWVNVISFLNQTASDEKALDLIKESQIFEKYLISTSEDLFKKMAIITARATNSDWGSYDQIQKLIGQSEYFFEKQKVAMPQIFQSILKNAKILQKKYYEHMENYFKQNDSDQSSLVDGNRLSNTISYSQFLIEIREQLADTEEYYILKFQVLKLKLVFTYHSSNFFPTLKKLLALPEGSTEIPLYTQFQEIKTMLYTIQPLYDYQRDFYYIYSCDKFSLFKDITGLEATIFYTEDKPEKATFTTQLFQYFEQFMKTQKESILEIVNAVNQSIDKKQVTEFEEIEWIDVMSKIDKISNSIELKKDELVAELNVSNLRGHLVARIQALYLLFKDFSDNECYNRKSIFWKDKNWTYLFKELKSLETSFMKCQNQCKTYFFQNLNELSQKNYVSQEQKQILQLVLKEGITYEEENEIEQRSNLDDIIKNLRQDLIFFEGNEQDMINVLERFVDQYQYLVYDYSDQMDQKFQEHKRFVKNQNQDFKQIIESLQNCNDQGFNNPNFISILQSLQEPLQRQCNQIYYLLDKAEDFFKFIDQGKLHDLMKLFIFMRKLDPFSLQKDKNFDELAASPQEISNSFAFQAYLSYQSICKNLSSILCQFIDIYADRANIDKIKENGVYEDEQEFFCNFFYQLTSGLLYLDGQSKIETQEKKEQSLLWLNSQEKAPELLKDLLINKDLRKVQTSLVKYLANIFNSFEHLKKKEPKAEEKPTEDAKVEEEKKEETKVEEEKKEETKVEEEKKEETKVEEENTNKETDVKTGEEVTEVERQEIKQEESQEKVAEKQDNDISIEQQKKVDEGTLDANKVELDDQKNEEDQIIENKPEVQIIEEIKEKTEEEKEQEKKDLEKKAEDEKKEAERKAEEEKKEAEKKAEEERLQKEKEEADRLKKEQIEKDRARIRPTLITIDEFYKFMEFMQKSYLQVTSQWAEQKQNLIKFHETYVFDMINNEILPQTPSLKELKESLYEPVFAKLVSSIDKLKDFTLFGGENQDFDQASQLLFNVDKLLQQVFRFMNKLQLSEYFEKIKTNDKLNKNAFKQNIIYLHNILIDGKINLSQKEFNQLQQNLYGKQRWPNTQSFTQKELFQNQIQILKDKTAKQKHNFLIVNLELIFRCLQVLRIFEQKYVGKIQNLQKKLEDINKKPEEGQKTELKGEYSTKVISYISKIQELSNQQFSSKTLQYLLECKNYLSQFDLSKESFEEIQNLLASMIDASQFIQMINKKILQNFKEQSSLKEILENVQIDTTFDLHQGLGSIETDETSLQLTTASGTINLIKIQNAVFSSDLLKDQFAHIMKKMLEIKARKQFQFRLEQEKKEMKKLNEIEISQKDSEYDFQKFVTEFSQQVLGNGGIDEIDSRNKPQSEDSTKLFTQIMQQAIPVFCQVTMPTKVISENLDKSIISLKQEVVDNINSKKADDENLNDNQNEVKLYENLMNQLSLSGKFWLQKIDQTWLEQGQYQEDIRNWHNSTMLVLRSISQLSRSSLNKKSNLLNKILSDFDDELCLIQWFKNVYLPIRLLGYHTFKVENENLNSKDDKKKENFLETTIFMIADYNKDLENNVQSFLNELIGYSLFQSESVKAQRNQLRQKIIESCINQIQNYANKNFGEHKKELLNMTLIQKTQVISSIMIIYYLMNQQNNVESAKFLFEWKSENQISFQDLINNLIGQLQWLTQAPFDKEVTSGKLNKSELLSKLKGITTQAFACQMIDRLTQILYYFNQYQSDTLKIEQNKLNLEKKLRSKNKKLIKNEVDSEQKSDNQGPVDSTQISSTKFEETQIQDSDIASEEEENYDLPASFIEKPKEENQIVSESKEAIPEKKEVENNLNEEEENNQNRDEDEEEGEPWELTCQRDQFLRAENENRRVIPPCNENDPNDKDEARLFFGIYPRVQKKPKSLDNCSFQTKNHIYALELDILAHHIYDYGSDCSFRDFNTQKDKIENHLPNIFQNLKPLSLSNFYELGNLIEQFFFTQKANREKRQFELKIKEEDEKKEINFEKQGYDDNYYQLDQFIYGSRWSDLKCEYNNLYSHQSIENNDDRKKAIIQSLNTIDKYQEFIGITGLGFNNLGLINLKPRAIEEKKEDQSQENSKTNEENIGQAKQEETQIEENKNEMKPEEIQVQENQNQINIEQNKTPITQNDLEKLDSSIDSDTSIHKEKDVESVQNITQILQNLIDENIVIILQTEEQTTQENKQEDKSEEKKDESVQDQPDKKDQIVENKEKEESGSSLIDNQDQQIVENKIQEDSVPSIEQQANPTSTEDLTEAPKDPETQLVTESEQASELKTEETKIEGSQTEESKVEESKTEEAKIEEVKAEELPKEPENLTLSELVAQIKDPLIRRQLLLDLTKEDIEKLNDEQKEELKKLKEEKVSKETEVKQKEQVDPTTQTFQTLLGNYFMETHQGFVSLEENLLIPLNTYQAIDDEMIQKLLINVLFNDFRNLSYKCLLQFIQSNTEQSQDQIIKSKIVNAIVFLLKTALKMNQTYFLQFLQIPSEKIQINQQQWHKIFMRLSFCLQDFIIKNPKIAQEFLNGFIKPEKEFHGKRDHNLKMIDKILTESSTIESDSNHILNPPFITFIQIMHDLVDERDKLKKISSKDEKQTKLLKDTETKSSKIQLLITEVLKQFDQEFSDDDAKFKSHKIELKQQAKEIQKQENYSAFTTFGLLTNESIKTLTEITILPNANKKMSKALNNIMLKVSSLSILDFYICNLIKDVQSDQINENSNLTINLDLSSDRLQFNSSFKNASDRAAKICQQNFSQIISKEKRIGQESLGQMIDFIWNINDITGCHELPQLQQQSSLPKLEKTLSQQDTLKQQMTLSSKTKKIEQIKQLTADEKKEVKEQMEQMKEKIKPFSEVLQVLNILLFELVKNKEKNEKIKQKLQKDIISKQKTHQQLVNYLQSEGKSVEQENEIKKYEEKVVKIQKQIEEDQKLKSFIELSVKLQDYQINSIHDFYKEDELLDFVEQSNQFIQFAQQISDDFEPIKEGAKLLFNVIFLSFYPEFLLEIIQNQNKKKDDSQSINESKYVKMEKIEKADVQSVPAAVAGPIESKTLIRMSTQVVRTAAKTTQLLVFRSDIEQVSERLEVFNSFCLKNKELLNKIVKQSLEKSEKSEMISLLKYMPNLLTMENKQELFWKEIQKMQTYEYFEPEIKRDDIFMDSFDKFIYQPQRNLKGRFKIRFFDEPGYDAGGVRRDFFSKISQQIFNQDLGLFTLSDNGSTYKLNPRSSVQLDYVNYYKFIGRIIAKAIFEHCQLECYFVSSIYKMIIGQPLSFKDLQDIDNNLFTGLNWCLLPSSDVEPLYETFSIDQDYFGKNQTIDIVPGGSELDLNNDNKEYYVERKAYFLLYKQVQKQMDAFLEGFYDVIPSEIISLFTYKELEILISGSPDYTIADLKANTEYENGYSEKSKQIIWFWEIMETLNSTDKANFLQFVTGSSKVPVQGFALLWGMGGPQKFTISRITGSENFQLPVAHTCYNQIDLPEYSTKEMLEEKLLWAIKEAQGFGFG